eukprot:CAMPEP_0177655928 /NCGR_PEP_ID=MMETSP0447-20121125/15257_1 /TAXON_ID=0 /ORGANISM="Stygamoeba regulata, Strain BSH-02190019" /LENGTH=117 /DNA_ID=CAMNT_0019159937 /DNA_START=88 /DNA_END=441 /DNA_ORIENTATION=-
MSIGAPVKLLHEAESHVVTVELKSGEVYRGNLLEAEDNMNMAMRNITVTGRDGKVSQLDQVYIRGSKVSFVIVPDMLRHAPMFKRADPNKASGRGVGRGRVAVKRAKARGRAPVVRR